MTILLLGGDGYLGWPLALKLALRHPDARLVIADNLARRRLVAEVGGNSVIPVEAPEARVAAYRRVFGRTNLEFVSVDAATPAVDELIARLRPDVVYHLAQQASAPYSMTGPEQAAWTVQNNEVGNLRVLFAVRKHVPDAHIVKLGSFGEYGRYGLDIAEGYFRPSYGGKTATRMTPCPRESDDIYHITKINDTNFIAMACRKWGLRVTDVMQSTIFGTYTEETFAHPELHTRFDYDAVFGTVVNRFLAQVIVGHPITVYGTGFQRTGLMALDDSLSSLASMATRLPATGEHRVINHVTLRDWCINDIAALVTEVADSRGFAPAIHREYDPRCERDPVKQDYRIETAYVDEHLRATPFEAVVAPMFDILARHRDRIDPRVFAPRVRW